jgi:hypothetical protein
MVKRVKLRMETRGWLPKVDEDGFQLLECKGCQAPTRYKAKFKGEKNHEPYQAGLCDGCLCFLNYEDFACRFFRRRKQLVEAMKQ